MFLIGITGGIASGKSTVSKLLTNYGCTVVDADEISKSIMLPGCKAYNECITIFGKDILGNGGFIEREKLAEIIFNNKEKRKQLNKITHPEIRKSLIIQIFKAFFYGQRFVICDIPLLIESNLCWFFKEIVVVYTSQDIQLIRLMNRNKLSEIEAKARIESQLKLEDKLKFATFVIDNNSSFLHTEKQVAKLYKKITSFKSFTLYELMIIVILMLAIIFAFIN